MTLTCPKCGKQIEGTAVNVAQDVAFCASCGEVHKISALTAQQNIPPPQPAQDPVQPAQPQAQYTPPPQQTYQPQQTPPVPKVSPPQEAPQKKKFCMKCGAPAGDGVKFCKNCGASMEAPPVQRVPDQTPPVQPNLYQQQYATNSAPQYAPPAATQKNPWQYFIEAFKKYAVFKGRARRAEFWWFILCYTVIYFIVDFLGAKMGLVAYSIDSDFSINILSTLASLVFLLPSLAVSIRRMHDTGKSGWLLLVPIYNIVLCATAGTSGPNQYGPDPKGN